MEIWLNTNISTHHFISEDYWYKNYDIVKELIPQAEIYTYIEDDTIKAFIATLDTTYIAGFFVSQPWQSQGIGKKLLDFGKGLLGAVVRTDDKMIGLKVFGKPRCGL